MFQRVTLTVLLVVAASANSAVRTQENAARKQAYDALLDMNVRDGQVYYRALKSDRARLDAYVTSLQDVKLDAASRHEAAEKAWQQGWI